MCLNHVKIESEKNNSELCVKRCKGILLDLIRESRSVGEFPMGQSSDNQDDKKNS